MLGKENGERSRESRNETRLQFSKAQSSLYTHLHTTILFQDNSQPLRKDWVVLMIRWNRTYRGSSSAVLLSLVSVTGNKPRLDSFRVRNNFRYLCFASLRNIDDRYHLSLNYHSTITLHCVSLVVDYLAFTAGHAVGILPWTDPDAEGMTLLVISESLLSHNHSLPYARQDF